MRGRSQAVLLSIALFWLAACSGSHVSGPGSSASSAPATSAPKPAAAFVQPADGCVLSAQTVANLTGLRIATAEPNQMSFTTSPIPPVGCMYSGSQHGSTVLVGISFEPTRPGWTAQQYLAENKLGKTSVMMPTQQNLPGVGDLATFGTSTIADETIDVVSLVQTLQQTVADISVTASGSAITQQQTVALARAVLAAITH